MNNTVSIPALNSGNLAVTTQFIYLISNYIFSIMSNIALFSSLLLSCNKLFKELGLHRQPIIAF